VYLASRQERRTIHEFKLVGRNALDGMKLARPGAANGGLFIWTPTRLFRITKR